MKKLWDSYASAWSMKDGEFRRTILEKYLTPDVTYTDPETQTSGYEEISAWATSLVEP